MWIFKRLRQTSTTFTFFDLLSLNTHLYYKQAVVP